MWNPFKPGFGHYYNVHVFDDIGEMHDYSLKISETDRIRRAKGETPQWVGLVVPKWIFHFDKEGQQHPAPKVGDILLSNKHLGVTVVAHEAVHAATSFLRLIDKLNLDDEIDDNEECFAHCVGSISKQIYQKLYDKEII